MSKIEEKGFALLDEMAFNNYQWPVHRFSPKKVAIVVYIDTLIELQAETNLLLGLSKKLDIEPSRVNMVQSPYIVYE